LASVEPNENQALLNNLQQPIVDFLLEQMSPGHNVRHLKEPRLVNPIAVEPCQESPADFHKESIWQYSSLHRTRIAFVRCARLKLAQVASARATPWHRSTPGNKRRKRNRPAY